MFALVSLLWIDQAPFIYPCTSSRRYGSGPGSMLTALQRDLVGNLAAEQSGRSCWIASQVVVGPPTRRRAPLEASKTHTVHRGKSPAKSGLPNARILSALAAAYAVARAVVLAELAAEHQGASRGRSMPRRIAATGVHVQAPNLRSMGSSDTTTTTRSVQPSAGACLPRPALQTTGVLDLVLD